MHKAAFEIKRLVLAATGIGLISAMALPTNAAAMCAARTQLGGFWKSEDGATYDMRLTNGQVWWVGRSAEESLWDTQSQPSWYQLGINRGQP